ncbi:MAG TPA: DUF3093 family protein [Actinomycetota bacterium]|nr:DUF3093 family protein [Actinomycetota bacterium]
MTYREVIRPPWWSYGALVGVSALFCFAFAAVSAIAALLLFVFSVIGGTWLLSRRGLVVSVDGARLQVGDRQLPVSEIGEVRALDAGELRMVAGPQADPRAELMLRNLAVKEGVKVELTAGDVPYWLISSKDPTALAEALTRD